MRREHYVKSGGASANLIFYAPLTENDLTDHISGASMLFTSTTHTWNATHGMYEFKKSGTGKAYWSGLDLGLPFTSSDYSNVECSCFFDYVMTDSNDKKYVNLVGLAIGQDGSTSKRFPLFFLKFIGTTITVNIKYRMGWTLRNGVFKFYVDGQEVDLNSPYAPVDTFDYTGCNAYVSLAAGNWSGNDGGGCFGNIRIYDRALTASEVAHYKQLIDNGLIFHAPLTTNSTDIIGGKTSVVEAVSYSSDGAYFDTNNNYKYLAYQLSESEFKSVKTIYAEFYRTTNKYNTETVYILGGVVGPLYDYSSNYEGVTRNYRDIWHDLDCLSAKYSAATISDWRYDFDANSNTSVSTNTWHKGVSCTYPTRQFLYLDGTKDFERNNTDTFQNYDFTTKNHTGLYLFVGGRVQQNEKMFEGYIRNVMMFNKEFSDAELAAMTSLI